MPSGLEGQDRKPCLCDGKRLAGIVAGMVLFALGTGLGADAIGTPMAVAGLVPRQPIQAGGHRGF